MLKALVGERVPILAIRTSGLQAGGHLESHGIQSPYCPVVKWSSERWRDLSTVKSLLGSRAGRGTLFFDSKPRGLLRNSPMCFWQIVLLFPKIFPFFLSLQYPFPVAHDLSSPFTSTAWGNMARSRAGPAIECEWAIPLARYKPLKFGVVCYRRLT